MENLKIKIRPMERGDIDDIVKLEESNYGEHHWSKDSFYQELSNNLARYFCAIGEDGKLLGYAGCWIILDESHITNISVDPNFRGRKIGEALLVRMFEACYKEMVKYMTLEVRVSNAPAIGLYSKYLFKSLGTRKGYYQNNNEDALIMWTENIFWDKFKEQFEKNKSELKNKVTVE